MTWKPSTLEVLPQNFDAIVEAHAVAVFHFWAEWNQYDTLMDEVLQDIVKVFQARVFVGSVDVADPANWERCRSLGILNLPALVSFVQGKHFQTLIGMRSRSELNAKIEEWLKT